MVTVRATSPSMGVRKIKVSSVQDTGQFREMVIEQSSVDMAPAHRKPQSGRCGRSWIGSLRHCVRRVKKLKSRLLQC